MPQESHSHSLALFPSCWQWLPLTILRIVAGPVIARSFPQQVLSGLPCPSVHLPEQVARQKPCNSHPLLPLLFLVPRRRGKGRAKVAAAGTRPGGCRRGHDRLIPG